MEIKRTLVLSTAHLPKDEFNRLSVNSEQLPFRVSENEYGAIIILAVDECVNFKYVDKFEELSPNLKPIIDLAITNDVTNIEFDCDGDIIEGLVEFDWDNNSQPTEKEFKLSAVFIEENRYEYLVKAKTIDDAKVKLKRFCKSDEGHIPYTDMDEFEGIKCFDAERAWSTKNFSHIID